MTTNEVSGFASALSHGDLSRMWVFFIAFLITNIPGLKGRQDHLFGVPKLCAYEGKGTCVFSNVSVFLS